MEKVISSVKEVRKYIDGLLDLPFRCWVFLVALLLSKHSEIVESINANNWFPKNLNEAIKLLFALVFDNILCIVLTLICLVVLISVLHWLSFCLPERIQKKLFPDPIVFLSGKTQYFYESIAINRIGNILLEILTGLWSCYFLFSTLFSETNILELNTHIGAIDLKTNGLIFWINVLYLIVKLRLALFVYMHEEEPRNIDGGKIDDYINIAIFDYTSVIASKEEKFEIRIIKGRYFKKNKYRIVKAKRTNNSEEYLKKHKDNKIPISQLHYKIINSSDDFEEVRYQFEEMKKDKSFD
ncbi:hypothetical protein [Lactovum odontotermitis]